MKVYVVQGRHGELHVTRKLETALALWADTNGGYTWDEFCNEYRDEIETCDIPKGYFLDECGRVDELELE